MPPQSLVELCLRVAIDNVHLITDLSNLPPMATYQILRAIKSPVQLHEVELNTPGLYDETAEHWRRLVKNHFPFLETEYRWEPKYPDEWWKVYNKYKAEQTARDAAATEQLKAAFASREQEKKSKLTTIMSVAEARRMPGALPRHGRGPADGSGWRSGSGSRGDSSGLFSNTRRKMSAVDKAKQEARREALRTKNSVPMGKMPVRTQIAKAPASMVNDARINRQFDPDKAPVIRSVRSATSAQLTQQDKERKLREERLLRIKNAGSSKPKVSDDSNVLSFDDDGNEAEVSGMPRSRKKDASEDGDGDDLFGDRENDKEFEFPYRAATPPPPSSESDSAYLIEELGPSPAKATASPSKSSSSILRDKFAKRRGGLLSAAPGANSCTPTKRSPPTSPPTRAATVARSSSSASPAPAKRPAGDAALSPPAPKRKSAGVDIFMRQNKRPRN
ncbi:hypothetical protein QBC46DRAFT_379288 [Diplogelasinospora grovesii]|uniref:Elongin-A n=1 Tax=Diplogelasinospora grovesii TaxID=303347 RepID=A0AAN6NEI9_9PEZI|nr:hypothetical protein QBC46DRAFT_379288 [Diplogelasinospora grovesii]